MGGGLCLRQQVWQLARHGQISHTPSRDRGPAVAAAAPVPCVSIEGRPWLHLRSFVLIRFHSAHISRGRALILSLNSDTRTSHRTDPRVTLWGSGNYLGGKLMASGTIVLVANSWHRELGGKLGDAIAQRAHLR